ncbi:hypothetical protein LTR70_007380 [Exophiala xenobiotica]|uniref:Nucleoside phosphorylase domain-containing protein n=1 Tax=Lithohypha guttulata TaxID=1690604 RepID=A0ABR0K4M3_9EURO|nr:hypothetical protein LTR24_006891 [Lithohypha guttulata]KAK5313958.1 hypothetical protein LTR70_007380 [Exophiala xenobiotica]
MRVGLLGGIGGGIPDLEQGVDIRLGDVVISQPSGTSGGVEQYDLGKSTTGGIFERKGMLNAPPTVLLTALQSLKAEHELEESQMSIYLTKMLERRPKMRSTGHASPSVENDVLYRTGAEHIQSMATCDACDLQGQVSRPTRATSRPYIHYGVVASGNQVIKSSAKRDQLRTDLGALCVEMEAAGLMNNFPCLVIRGICDYADSHKNDRWQKYAACTAAAFAKELLLHVSAEQTSHEESIGQILGIATSLSRLNTKIDLDQLRVAEGAEFDAYGQVHAACHPATRIDLLHSIQNWARQPDRKRIFWLNGMAGTGKSTISWTIAQWLTDQAPSGVVDLGGSFF